MDTAEAEAENIQTLKRDNVWWTLVKDILSPVNDNISIGLQDWQPKYRCWKWWKVGIDFNGSAQFIT